MPIAMGASRYLARRTVKPVTAAMAQIRSEHGVARVL